MTIHKTGTEENSQKYLSLREAAQLYGYTRDHLGLMIRREKLRGVRLGNYYATSVEWMEEYIKNHADSDHPRSKNKFSNKFRAVFEAKSGFNPDPVSTMSVVSLRSAPLQSAFPQPALVQPAPPQPAFSRPTKIRTQKPSRKSVAAHLERPNPALYADTMNFSDLQEDIEKILKNNQEIKLVSASGERKIIFNQDFLILPIRKMDDFERQMIISKARNQKQ